MYKRHIIGQEGEKIAKEYLAINNYKIINTNFSCNKGEIDIIVKDKEKDEIVFVEVKSRTNLNYGMPSESVDNTKVKHIKKTIQYYLYKNKIENTYVRIDVIEVELEDKKIHINHIKNAIID